MKKILFILLMAASQLLAQSADKNSDLSRLEQRIAETKKNSAPADLKANRGVISDIENRKNNLKMMLKTPEADRNADWNSKWDKEYKLTEDKLNKLSSGSK
jgi:hypothetical protein